MIKTTFHETVSVNFDHFGPITRSDWEVFIQEVKEGKRDWPAEKPKGKSVTIVGPDHSSKTLMNGDSVTINGAEVKVFVN